MKQLIGGGGINTGALLISIIHLFQIHNIIEMNKWLLITLLSVFVINLTFKSSNAVTVNIQSLSKSGNVGLKR